MTGVNERRADALAKFEVSQQLKEKTTESFIDQVSKLDHKEYSKQMEKLFITAYKNPDLTKKDKKQILRAYELTKPLSKLLSDMERWNKMILE